MKGKRTITMEDIARLAHVSKPTVSRALRNSPLVTKETRRLIMDVAREYGYVVNRNAQKLRQSRADTVAVVLDFKSHRENRISDPFIFSLLAGVSEALGQRDQDLLLCAPGHANMDNLPSIIASRGADGILFLGEGGRRAELIALASDNVPFVVWGAVEDDLPFCAVGSDNFRGGFLAGEHLLARGRSRFLFVGDARYHEINLRRKGLVAALTKSDRPTNLTDMPMDDFSYASTLKAAREIIQNGVAVPDAVFAVSDTAAMAVIAALRDAGLSVPGDVSVVGYNNIPGAEYFHPPLSTIGQDVHSAGALLVDKLMQLINGEERPPSAMLETRLIVRESS